MIRLLLTSMSVLAASVATAQQAVPLTGAGGKFRSASYTGLGDLSGLTSPVAYWGTDGITNAYTGNALNVCDAAGANCGDFTVLHGQLQVSIRGSTDCTGGTCVVATIYDQTGGNNCTGSCNLVQATNNQRANLTFNCPTSGHWCLTFPNSSIAGLYHAYGVGGNMTVSAPFSITHVANSTYIGGTTGGASNLYYDGSMVQVSYNPGPAPNLSGMYEGSTVATATASNGSNHSISSVFNNASSDIVVDGTSNPVSTGTTSGISSSAFIASTDITGAGQPFAGTICNLAIYSFAFTSGEKTSINTNQHSFACGGGF